MFEKVTPFLDLECLDVNSASWSCFRTVNGSICQDTPILNVQDHGLEARKKSQPHNQMFGTVLESHVMEHSCLAYLILRVVHALCVVFVAD